MQPYWATQPHLVPPNFRGAPGPYAPPFPMASVSNAAAAATTVGPPPDFQAAIAQQSDTCLHHASSMAASDASDFMFALAFATHFSGLSMPPLLGPSLWQVVHCRATALARSEEPLTGALYTLLQPMLPPGSGAPHILHAIQRIATDAALLTAAVDGATWRARQSSRLPARTKSPPPPRPLRTVKSDTTQAPRPRVSQPTKPPQPSKSPQPTKPPQPTKSPQPSKPPQPTKSQVQPKPASVPPPPPPRERRPVWSLNVTMDMAAVVQHALPSAVVPPPVLPLIAARADPRSARTRWLHVAAPWIAGVKMMNHEYEDPRQVLPLCSVQLEDEVDCWTFSPLQCMARLVIVDLSGCLHVDDHCLLVLPPSCEVVRLRDCGITDAGVRQLLWRLRSLRTLDTRRCPKVDDRALRSTVKVQRLIAALSVVHEEGGPVTQSRAVATLLRMHLPMVGFHRTWDYLLRTQVIYICDGCTFLNDDENLKSVVDRRVKEEVAARALTLVPYGPRQVKTKAKAKPISKSVRRVRKTFEAASRELGRCVTKQEVLKAIRTQRAPISRSVFDRAWSSLFPEGGADHQGVTVLAGGSLSSSVSEDVDRESDEIPDETDSENTSEISAVEMSRALRRQKKNTLPPRDPRQRVAAALRALQTRSPGEHVSAAEVLASLRREAPPMTGPVFKKAWHALELEGIAAAEALPADVHPAGRLCFDIRRRRFRASTLHVILGGHWWSGRRKRSKVHRQRRKQNYRKVCKNIAADKNRELRRRPRSARVGEGDLENASDLNRRTRDRRMKPAVGAPRHVSRSKFGGGTKGAGAKHAAEKPFDWNTGKFWPNPPRPSFLVAHSVDEAFAERKLASASESQHCIPASISDLDTPRNPPAEGGPTPEVGAGGSAVTVVTGQDPPYLAFAVAFVQHLRADPKAAALPEDSFAPHVRVRADLLCRFQEPVTGAMYSLLHPLLPQECAAAGLPAIRQGLQLIVNDQALRAAAVKAALCGESEPPSVAAPKSSGGSLAPSMSSCPPTKEDRPAQYHRAQVAALRSFDKNVRAMFMAETNDVAAFVIAVGHWDVLGLPFRSCTTDNVLHTFSNNQGYKYHPVFGFNLQACHTALDRCIEGHYITTGRDERLSLTASGQAMLRNCQAHWAEDPYVQPPVIPNPPQPAATALFMAQTDGVAAAVVVVGRWPVMFPELPCTVPHVVPRAANHPKMHRHPVFGYNPQVCRAALDRCIKEKYVEVTPDERGRAGRALLSLTASGQAMLTAIEARLTVGDSTTPVSAPGSPDAPVVSPTLSAVLRNGTGCKDKDMKAMFMAETDAMLAVIILVGCWTELLPGQRCTKANAIGWVTDRGPLAGHPVIGVSLHDCRAAYERCVALKYMVAIIAEDKSERTLRLTPLGETKLAAARKRWSAIGSSRPTPSVLPPTVLTTVLPTNDTPTGISDTRAPIEKTNAAGSARAMFMAEKDEITAAIVMVGCWAEFAFKLPCTKVNTFGRATHNVLGEHPVIGVSVRRRGVVERCIAERTYISATAGGVLSLTPQGQARLRAVEEKWMAQGVPTRSCEPAPRSAAPVPPTTTAPTRVNAKALFTAEKDAVTAVIIAVGRWSELVPVSLACNKSNFIDRVAHHPTLEGHPVLASNVKACRTALERCVSRGLLKMTRDERGQDVLSLTASGQEVLRATEPRSAPVRPLSASAAQRVSAKEEEARTALLKVEADSREGIECYRTYKLLGSGLSTAPYADVKHLVQRIGAVRGALAQLSFPGEAYVSTMVVTLEARLKSVPSQAHVNMLFSEFVRGLKVPYSLRSKPEETQREWCFEGFTQRSWRFVHPLRRLEESAFDAAWRHVQQLKQNGRGVLNLTPLPSQSHPSEAKTKGEKAKSPPPPPVLPQPKRATAPPAAPTPAPAPVSAPACVPPKPKSAKNQQIQVPSRAAPMPARSAPLPIATVPPPASTPHPSAKPAVPLPKRVLKRTPIDEMPSSSRPSVPTPAAPLASFDPFDLYSGPSLASSGSPAAAPALTKKNQQAPSTPPLAQTPYERATPEPAIASNAAGAFFEAPSNGDRRTIAQDKVEAAMHAFFQ